MCPKRVQNLRFTELGGGINRELQEPKGLEKTKRCRNVGRKGYKNSQPLQNLAYNPLKIASLG